MNITKNILGIIPARAGSKRIPSKNTKLLGDKELVRYAIESALGSERIDTLVVSSDDNRVLEITEEYDRLKPIKRPHEISGDRAQAIEYVQHCIKELKIDFSHVVIIQPTSPFTLANDIDATIDILLGNNKANSSVSVMKVDHAIHPIKLKLMDGLKLNPYVEEENGRMAAHEIDDVYARNCSVYVSKIDVINQGDIIGDYCLGYEMPRERSLDINDPIDFDFAEFMIMKNG